MYTYFCIFFSTIKKKYYPDEDAIEKIKKDHQKNHRKFQKWQTEDEMIKYYAATLQRPNQILNRLTAKFEHEWK